LQALCDPSVAKGLPVYFHVMRNGEAVASFHAPEVKIPVEDAAIKKLTEIFGAANIRMLSSS
ncbi:MAG: hypothetical protein ACK54V_07845, partial [Candidatus Kapaibacterium sp.]